MKQDQHVSKLQARIATDLSKRLAKQPTPAPAADLPSELSMRRTWAVILFVGGLVAIIMALISRQNPHVLGGNVSAGILALCSVACVVLAAVLLWSKRPHKR